MRPHYLKLWILSLLVLPMFMAPAVLALTPAEIQVQLQEELKAIEAEIKQYSTELAQTQSQKATLANKIKQLQIKQKALNLQIKETGLKLNDLSGKIVTVSNNIQTNLTKEQELQNAMKITLRKINMADGNIIFALFGKGGLAGMFTELQNYTDLISALEDLKQQTKQVRSELGVQQNLLEDQKTETSDLLKIKSIQQQGLKSTLGEQNQLLTVTKGKESNYQTILSDSKKRAAEIKSRMYELFNVGTQINFGQAVDIAKWASSLTGIRPAFLLAILTQESNLGKNVGTCNRPGDPPSKSWKVIMKPERDQTPFVQITQELKMNTDTTPVSCPMRDKNGNQVGWGGAMGPAQFIPSTWLGYRNKVTALTGSATANPWDIRDAFLASAIKLRADGANGTDEGDWKAAMRYFSGGVNLKNRFYGDNVIATTKQYLEDIGGM